MKATDIKESIKKDIYKDRLIDIYGQKDYLNQKDRYLLAIDCFIDLFGDLNISIVSAPGRSEIGGNHTDHQGGNVIAAAIDLDSIAVISKSDGNIIDLYSESYGRINIDLNDLEIKKEEYQTTKSLVKGVVRYLKDEGYNIGAFKAYVTSKVLTGSGLSSSASFEALIGTIISALFNEEKISLVEIAKIGQKAENNYFGKPCGLMDQVACSLGNLVHIDFKDKNNPIIESIDYDFSKSGYSICIVDVNASHADLTDEYASIPLEMKKVCEYFNKDILTQVDEEEFYKNISNIRKKVGDRPVLRAINFYNENNRVIKQSKLLKENKFDEFLKLVKESGDSSFKYLQNIYANKDFNNQALSLALAVSEKYLKGNGVSRVHGGGFAGTILVFVKDEYVSIYKEKIEGIFGQGNCHVLSIRKYGGIKVL